ncbi:co-chaperone GroES, partial [Patescibacteria group bacterium]|nr:co-chaperone GroES [Patescibacteria group bacterium]
QEAEEVTASGIVLPDSAQEKPAQGKVLAIGAPVYIEGKEIKPEFKLGENVLFKKWGGDEIKLEGKELKLVKFEDVMAILG